MECPTCKKDSLRTYTLTQDLPAYRCTECEGIWLSALQYWNWLKKREDTHFQVAGDDIPLPAEEPAEARLCPECGRLLRHYKVWPNVDFHVDRCEHCRSMWFDRGEWAALHARGLSNQVHLFFMDVWQAQVRAEEAKQRFADMYRDRFGAEDYAHLREIREWLDQHPLKGALLAYLTDRDPYRAISDGAPR